MGIRTSIMGLVCAVAMVMGMTVRAQTVPQTVTYEFEGDAAIWDVSSSSESIDLGGMGLNFSFTVDAKGKITGSGSTHVNVSGISLTMNFVVTGSVSKSGSVVRVTLTLKGKGSLYYDRKTYKFSASVSSKGSLDTADGALIMVTSGSVSVSGYGTEKIPKTTTEMQVCDCVDGSWELSLDNLTESRGKVLGSGRIYVEGGKEYYFTVKGTYSAKTGLAKVTLSGLNQAKGISFAVENRKNLDRFELRKMSGKLMGQSVKR